MSRSTKEQTRYKVLLVDDDAVSLEIVGLLLAHEGHQVLKANDAGIALKLLSDRTKHPDVLLVDLQMPGISGGQLAEKVRATERSGPVMLAMSATEVPRQQLLAFDGFLLKPLAPDDLRKAMEEHRRGRSPGVRNVHRSKAPAASTDIVDIAVIEKLLTMMPLDALQDTIAACIADTRSCVHALQGQVHHNDGVRRLAHRIKGAASMIGAVRLARLAASLETGGSKEAATPGALNDLLRACSELERMLLAGNLTKI
ncbi:MAG TPA: response regulator [Acidobacteriaceae bacterium]|nr:response regulator [Acidobacteriaceae bacterium]